MPVDPSAPAILTEGLTKHYGEVRALEDLDLEVRRGEVFGFLGPNGAGKTTAIRTLTDELRPTRGRASILGLDCRADSVELRRHLGYLPGDLALYPRLTGRETLRYFANLRGGVDETLVTALAERFDADLSVRVGEMSTGNRQKVGLVQSLMHRPEVVVMDEPSTGLDPLVQAEFHALLREIAAEGRTVFLSSHTLSEVERVADRVGIIRHGRLAAVESVSVLRRRAIRRVELRFEAPVDAEVFERVEGVREVDVEREHVVLSFDGRMQELLDAIRGGPALVDVETHEADLEEVFLTYYRDGTATDAAVGA